MSRWIERGLALMAMQFKQNLADFCDLDTADGPCLVSDTGDYQTYLRLDGMGHMLTSDEIVSGSMALREGIASALRNKGHAIQACFTYDPERSGPVIDRQIGGTRQVARAVGLNLEDLFLERRRVWSGRMAWEQSTMALWTRVTSLTRESQRNEKKEQKEALKDAPAMRECQGIWRTHGMVAQQHVGFVQAAVAALEGQGVHVTQLTPDHALRSMREAMYPETAGSDWMPSLPGGDVMPRISDAPPAGKWDTEDASGLLWDPIADQIFREDARTLGPRQVRIGDRDWTGVDMRTGPETPRAFVELLHKLRLSRTPFRIAFLIEGADESLMRTKKVAAMLLALASNANKRLLAQLEGLDSLRMLGQESVVKLRVSLATWAPARRCRRTASAWCLARLRRRGLGRLSGLGAGRRPFGGGDEQRPWACHRIDRSAACRGLGAGCRHAAMEPARLAMDRGQHPFFHARTGSVSLRSDGVAASDDVQPDIRGARPW